MSIKIKVCLNEFLNVIFENVDVDDKMYLTCDQYEPIYSTKRAFSSCIIALQFVSFLFYDSVGKVTKFGLIRITILWSNCHFLVGGVIYTPRSAKLCKRREILYQIWRLLFFIEIQPAKCLRERTSTASKLSHKTNRVPLLLQNLGVLCFK